MDAATAHPWDRNTRARAADALLAWYDAHAREMAWRVGPSARGRGERPDPYAVWLSEVMLQQTTVAAVEPKFRAFLARWPNVDAMARADDAEVMAAWAGLGYYARVRNMLAAARAVAEIGGFPETEAGLRALPGVGAYTAAAVAAIAFDEPATVVDGNVERVTVRLFAVETPLPDAKPALRRLVEGLTPRRRPGCFAQAMMDLGATVCRPKRAHCDACPWSGLCAGRRAGIAESLPRKTPKRAKPERHGTAWAVFDDRGRVLTVRRPERGLLGGMLALPSAGWSGEDDEEPQARWTGEGDATHVFTHFRLALRVRVGRLAAKADAGQWLDPADAARAMPTAFRKALTAALAARAASEEETPC